SIDTNSDVSRVAVADFNADNKLDFAGLDSSAQELQTYFNTGGGVFNPVPSTTALSNLPFDLVAGDFDGDGLPDVMIAEGTQVRFRKNTGGGVFDPVGVPVLNGVSNSFQRLASADFNSDGLPDVVALDNGGDGFVVTSDGGGTFTQDTGNPYPVSNISLD